MAAGIAGVDEARRRWLATTAGRARRRAGTGGAAPSVRAAQACRRRCVRSRAHPAGLRRTRRRAHASERHGRGQPLAPRRIADEGRLAEHRDVDQAVPACSARRRRQHAFGRAPDREHVAQIGDASTGQLPLAAARSAPGTDDRVAAFVAALRCKDAASNGMMQTQGPAGEQPRHMVSATPANELAAQAPRMTRLGSMPPSSRVRKPAGDQFGMVARDRDTMPSGVTSNVTSATCSADRPRSLEPRLRHRPLDKMSSMRH